MRRRPKEHELEHRAQQAEASRAAMETHVARLQAEIADLQRRNRDLDDFAYLASHDLKEPLRGVRAYCEVLLADYREKLDTEADRQLRAMMTMCDRLDLLIEDVLSYCRAGQLQGESPVDMNAVVHDVIELLHSTIQRRGGSVIVVDQLPVVAGDPSLLGMVVSNLVTNGLKFNESLRPCVEIGCLAGTEPTIYVRDNGIGISAEHHEAVFGVFRRLHGRRKYEGSGVGLAIVRKIIESHGGRVWVGSQPGQGSTFFFTLRPCPEVAGKIAAPSPHWNLRSNRAAPVATAPREKGSSAKGRTHSPEHRSARKRA